MEKDYHYLVIDQTLVGKYSNNRGSEKNETWFFLLNIYLIQASFFFRFFTILDQKATSNFSYSLSLKQTYDAPCPNECGVFGNAFCQQGIFKINKAFSDLILKNFKKRIL